MECRVHLVGPPRIHLGDREFRPAPTTVSSLAYLLAAHDGWISRDELCSYFWPDREDRLARVNLRQTLYVLKQEPYAVGIEAERNRVQWPVHTDLAAHGSLPNPSMGTDPKEFLAGFQLPDVPAFEAWLDDRRRGLRETMRTWARERAERASAAGRATEAMRILEPWLDADELDEGTLQLYLATCARADRRVAGIRRFERFQTMLQKELGLDPSETTLRLASDLRASEPHPEVAPGGTSRDEARLVFQTPAHHAGPLFGREVERERLVRWLDDAPGLVGIYGAGGMGKTRLATEIAARAHEIFPDGVGFIDMRSVHRAHQAAATVANAIEAAGTSEVPPLDRIGITLRDRRALMVLDNLEQIEGIEALLAELLERAPTVSILITSRRRFALQAIRAIELEGLRTDDGALALGTPSSAARLFSARAEALGTSVDAPDDLAVVEEICRAVRGMPLALELAAGWTRVLSLRDVAARWHVDLVQRPVPGDAREERHRTVRRVFESTWSLMAAADRQAMRRLTVFRGGCTLDAARDVADVGLSRLASLRDLSLVSVTRNGRVSQHPLVVRNMDDFAEPDPTLAARHARWYLELLREQEDVGQNSDPQSAIATMQADIANIEAAWSWALEHAAWDLLLGGAPTLGFAFLGMGIQDRWVELLEVAAASIPPHHIAWAYLETHAASMAGHAGRREEAYRRTRAAMDAVPDHADPKFRGWIAFLMANAALSCGRTEEARKAKRLAVDCWRLAGDDGLLSMALTSLHLLSLDRDEAERWHDEGEVVRARLRNPTHEAEVAVPRAYALARDWGRYEDALREVERAVAIQRSANWNALDLARALTAAAHVRLEVGSIEVAERNAREALDCTEGLGTVHYFDPRTSLVEWARARRLSGDLHGAREVLESNRAEGAPPSAAMHRESAAICLAEGRIASAWGHLHAAGSLLPADPYTRSHVAAGIELSIMEATAANAERRSELARGATGRVLRSAWTGRFVPLTLDALALAAAFLPSDLAVRVLSLVSASPATGFETLVRIGPLGHGISDATPTIGGAPHDGASVDERSIEAYVGLVLPHLGSDPS